MNIHAVGTEAGLRLCLPEVMSFIVNGLSSSSWSIKAQAGAAARTVAEKLGSRLGPPHLGVLINAVMKGLPGRTWTGKVELIASRINIYSQLLILTIGIIDAIQIVSVSIWNCRYRQSHAHTVV